ncbi:dTDP-glucose pyrophosphorylase [Klebsiella oxytoca]|uniref:dTDP-glucose pyrophosphorylase n=1 Tax=Klebsiella/Raoultella group TaxID=2890311 RepID=UPI00157A82E8|nr:dTDP-glucose pyrophosphorylase [Klebsiella oxytoca]
MSESPRFTTTLAMPEIDGVTLSFQGLHYLRPELMLDFVSVSSGTLLAITPVALLYSTVGVLQRLDLRKLPIEVSGRVIYPISSQQLPSLRAKLIINGQSRRLKFFESLVAMTPDDNVHGMQILGLSLDFTIAKPA